MTPSGLLPDSRPGVRNVGRAVPLPVPEVVPLAVPSLQSTLVQDTREPEIPWQYVFINLARLAQPTGVQAGTFNGITVNSHGQVIAATASGATIDSPNLTGTPVSVTPPATSNSNEIATTAWVHSFIQSLGYITDAPHDGNRYVRQNGAWVVIVSP